MQRSLARVRIAFLAIGIALLCALGMFVRSALVRLEHQRRLRHEVVAERIFDEVERELTTYLDSETARPSAAYDVEHSEPRNWAPFVVGYFTVESGYRVVGRNTLDAARVSRIEGALSRVWPSPAQPVEETSSVKTPQADSPRTAPSPAARRPKLNTGSDVLRQLNRAGEERQQPRRKVEPKLRDDPFAF